MTEGRIDFEVGLNTAKATFVSGRTGQALFSVEVGRGDGRPWASATQAVLASLQELVPHMIREARRLGIPT